MARVSIDGPTLVVDVEGMDKLWALKNRVVVPLAHVRGATHGPGIVKEPKGIRAPGAHVPGVLVAGTFHHEGERVFWDVHDAAGAVVIELDDEDYARLIVGVDDPAATVTLIESAIRGLPAG